MPSVLQYRLSQSSTVSVDRRSGNLRLRQVGERQYLDQSVGLATPSADGSTLATSFWMPSIDLRLHRGQFGGVGFFCSSPGGVGFCSSQTFWK